jgi:predicted nucleotidyltransferase
MTTQPLQLPANELAAYCRTNQITYLALFGSAVRGELTAASDVDLLIEFAPTARIGFLALGRMQRELSDLLGYPVDLVLRAGLKPQIRDEVLRSARVLFEWEPSI